MSVYTFMKYVEDYFAADGQRFSEETLKTRKRRYARINKVIEQLKQEKKISTASPKYFTPEDIRAYVNERKLKVSGFDVQQDINALNLLCCFLDNPAVTIAIEKLHIKPIKLKRQMLPSMSNELYEIILKRSNEIPWDDFVKVRAYTMVLVYINIGARNKELRLADVGDLDTTNWILYIKHPKGEGSYGQPRSIPVNPEIRQLINRYLNLRTKWVVDNNPYSTALFPGRTNTFGGYLSSNGIREVKAVVEKDLNIKFDLRQCRRTFGQRLIDKQVPLEVTSVLLGHATTKTTESFYCRMKNEKAIKIVQDLWKEDKDKEADKKDSTFQ